ncbi:putative WASH complex subunit 7-like [Trypanosoma grayi]|uniref:putative WASH complex subunit 7-like n=1 Tax=Trypanosoma grayi TaxID=71804 RepID=UPI0004F4185F|nr:putative WASH complex subunit 7-like [Trypanosoma grayi]KEG10151.1 putative WASH complex subunit 7-like [Trypanosoma grayi]
MLAAFDFGVDIGKEEREVFHDKLQLFVTGHEKMLMEIQQTFDRRWDPMMWDPHTDTVCMQLGARAAQLKERDVSIADTLGRTKLHNRLFYRITLCFASLVTEIDSLAAEATDVLIPPLAVFGDDSCREEGITDEEAQQGAGRMLGLLQGVWSWVQRVRKVVLRTVRQLAALYSPLHEHDNYRPFTQVRFPLVWRSLADLFSAMVCLEEVLQTHDTLRHGLSIYRKLLAQVSRNSERFEYDEMTMELFSRLLNKVECEVLDDGILQRLVMQLFDTQEEGVVVLVAINKLFCTEFTEILEQMLSTVEENVGTTREGDTRKRYVGILGMYYLYLYLFPQVVEEGTRRKLCRRVFALHRQMPVIYIRGVHLFRPAEWMARRVPVELSRFQQDPIKEGMPAIKQACHTSSTEFIPQLNRLTTLVSAWLAEMETTIPVDPSHYKKFLQSTTLLLQRGVLLAQHLQRLLINHIVLHNCADVAIPLQHVDGIAHGLQLLMMIRAAYHTKTGVMAAAYNLLLRSITYVMERHLYELHLGLSDVIQNGTEEVTDQYSAIGEAIALLHKPQTPENLVCLDLILSTVFNRRQMNPKSAAVITPKHSEEILIAFSQLNRVASYQTILHAATDCDFLYWQREAFYPLFFERLYQKPLKSDHLPYLLMAMHDCRPSILSSKHVDSAVGLLEAYIRYIWQCLRKHLIEPLCADIENELRLCTHSVVLGQPFRKIEPMTRARNLARFTRLAPFRFFNEWLHVATEVEHYLDAQFYNLNALMANDWKTYEEMRNLALERYGLHICDGYLPGSIVDQGLDVLVITENIQVFVANYTYNMNEQLFVQRPSTTESKHLHTLHIRHIANSIRTHGTGIMNTTVNYVYKCLLKKLAILSQFLYDDHVKSRLIKDAKLFQAQKEELNGEYPLSQAEKFIREMRKLGVADDGQTFLDKFRHLVSEIGNALGYMRMMRSGGLRAVADSAIFIPSIDNVVRLERVIDPDAIGSEDDEEEEEEEERERSEGKEEEDDTAKAPPCTVQAVRVVDRVIQNMRKKLSDGSEYFRMLLEAVTKRLKGAEKYSHLKNFHMIIPPICVLQVELMIREKEQLVKKNKDGLFTDDGFALGCAFLLKLFGVSEPFESLHWFECVRKHYAARLQAMQQGISQRNNEVKSRKKPHWRDAPHEDEEINNMHLTATMVDYAIREYATLEEAFVSSKVFFHSSVADESDEDESDDDENQTEG